MNTTAYFTFIFAVFAINMVAMTGYYIFAQRRDFMTVVDRPVSCNMKHAGVIQSLFLIAAATAFCFLDPDKEWIGENRLTMLVGCSGGFALIGLFPVKNKISAVLNTLLQMAGIAFAVSLLPENSAFFPPEAGLPEYADKVCAGILWFAVFRLMIRMDDLKSFTAQQGAVIGLLCVIALFMNHPLSGTFFRFSGILLPVSFILSIFFMFGAQIPSSRVFQNVFCFAVTWVPFYMASQGRWGSAALLLTYPLLEITAYCCRFFYGFLMKIKPEFLFETLENKGVPAVFIVRFIFRRNLLMGGLWLLSLQASLQYQPVVLAALFMLDSYIRIVSPSKKDTSLKTLFTDMASDAKKGFKETNKAFSDLKEKYKSKRDKNE